jgi:hypothetical protein
MVQLWWLNRPLHLIIKPLHCQLALSACGLVSRAILRYNGGDGGELMRDRMISIVAVLAAIIGWWGILELTRQVGPDQPGAQTFFYALLFLALTATLAPAIAYLNRRLAPEAVKRDPWRFLRHSAWAALCLASWAWLQTLRAFNLAFALVTALIFVGIELLIVRLKGET